MINFCPNCGYHLNHHESETPQTMSLPPVPPQPPEPPQPPQPVVLLTPRQVRKAEALRLKPSTRNWMRLYIALGALSIFLAIVVTDKILMGTFAILFIMIGHGLYASSRLTWENNNPGRHK